MIEGLKTDKLMHRLGGRFKLAALIQRRMVELLQGARPLVDTRGLTDIEVVIKEIHEDKIDIFWPDAETIHEVEEEEVVD
jgi:DNA-directed RNA polymerase subunit omega